MSNLVTSSTSQQFRVNSHDVLRGLLVAVITPVLTIIMTSLNAGELIFNWKAIGLVAVGAAVAYIIKNFLTPAAIIISAPPAIVEDVKNGDATVKVTST